MLSDTRNNRGHLSSTFYWLRAPLTHFILQLLSKAHQDGFKVAIEKVLERRQEVDGGALDQLPACAADLLLRLATFDQSVAWKRETQPQESLDWTEC